MKSTSNLNFMENQTPIKSTSKSALILIVLAMLVLPFTIYSQDLKIVNLNDYLKSESSTSRSSQVNTLKSLTKDAHPSLYVNNGEVNSYGKFPKVLFVDAASVSKLNTLKLDMNQVELVTIKINSKNDLMTPIDLEIFSAYPSVKTILINVSFDTTVDSLYRMIQTKNSKYTILYTIEKPS